jgi:hypothetical protein
MKRFWDKINVKSPNDCWEWLGAKDSWGYGTFTYRYKQYGSHRFALQLDQNIEIPSNLQVLHSCNNPSCCNPSHLRIGTQKDNIQDMIFANRDKIVGERNSNAKITLDDANQIRELYSTGNFTLVELANKFAISYTQTRRIVKRESWDYYEED